MKLKLSTKVSYGIGGIADNAMYTLQATYLMFFLTTVAGIEPALAGLIAALGSVWEAFCGPLVGYMSDNIETRFGKRKPFVLIAAIPSALVTLLTFTSINASPGVKFAYYLIMNLLYWQCFALFFVPMISWGSELTDDYNERTEIRTFAYIGNQVGAAFGKVVPVVLSGILTNIGLSERMTWLTIGGTIGFVISLSLLYSGLTIKETDVEGFVRPENRIPLFSKDKILSMFREYIRILKLRPIIFLIFSSIAFLIANTFFGSALIYNFEFRLGFSPAESAVSLLLITVAGIILSPLVAWFAGRTDKTNAYKVGLAISGFLLILFAIIDIRSFFGTCFLCLSYSIGNACYWQLMPSMIYDTCEAEELASGSNHRGQVISLQALSESVAAAIGVQLLGITLQLGGFSDTLEVQTEEAITRINQCTTIIPGILFIIVALLIIKHPINHKTYDRIIRALADRETGKKVDMNDFKDIYGKNLRGVCRDQD
jgi:GPH family glycoside/pentoside/hexuronide:cation symporter